MPKSKNYLTQLWRWVADQVVQDAPDGSALCAFDCKKGQCTQEEWAACQRRLHNAAGELMPAEEDDCNVEAKSESFEAEPISAKQLSEGVAKSRS